MYRLPIFQTVMFAMGLVVGLGSVAELMASAPRDTPRPPQPPFHLMTAEREARYRQALPEIDDPPVARILEDPRLILYTDREMPPAYQDWSGGLPGIHSPSYNISANSSERFGNGNVEFPWGDPGGTHRTSNVATFRFLWLPQDENGATLPMVWYRKRLSGDRQQGYTWIYPVGTVFGEVLRMRGPDNRWYTFEMRIRIREYGAWGIDVYRPFPSPESLSERIKQLRPHWEDDESLRQLVNHLEDPPPLQARTLSDRNHPRRAFHQVAGIDMLPPAGDDELIVELLTETTFRPAIGDTWRAEREGLFAAAPTTEADFHIVPAKYDAGFIELDRNSCMQCHETVNQHVNRFDFGRDWYGRIRGSDGIFSFHPFDPGSISYNGISSSVRMNPALERAGLLEPYNANKHPERLYHHIRGLE